MVESFRSVLEAVCKKKIVITLAKTLGMDTIAEGIETAEQLTQLKNLGGEFGQGYLFGEPLDVQEIESRLVSDGEK